MPIPVIRPACLLDGQFHVKLLYIERNIKIALKFRFFTSANLLICKDVVVDCRCCVE